MTISGNFCGLRINLRGERGDSELGMGRVGHGPVGVLIKCRIPFLTVQFLTLNHSEQKME